MNEKIILSHSEWKKISVSTAELLSYINTNKSNLSQIYVEDEDKRYVRPLCFAIVLAMTHAYIECKKEFLEHFDHNKILEQTEKRGVGKDNKLEKIIFKVTNYDSLTFLFGWLDSKQPEKVCKLLLDLAADPNVFYNSKLVYDKGEVPLLFAAIAYACVYNKQSLFDEIISREDLNINVEVDIEGNKLNALHYAAHLHTKDNSKSEVCINVLSKLIDKGMDPFKETIYGKEGQGKKSLNLFGISQMGQKSGLELSDLKCNKSKLDVPVEFIKEDFVDINVEKQNPQEDTNIISQSIGNNYLVKFTNYIKSFTTGNNKEPQ